MNKLIPCSLWLASAMATLAIESGRSSSEFTLDQSSLTGVASFAWQDIDAVLEIDLNKDGLLDGAELEQSESFLSEYGETLFHVQVSGDMLPAASVQYSWDSNLGTITFDYHYPLDSPLRAHEMQLEFAGHRDFPVGHQQQLKLVDSQGEVLTAHRVGDPSDRPLYPIPAPTTKAQSSSALEAITASSPAPSVHLALTLFAAGFLAIALAGSVWFIRRMQLA